MARISQISLYKQPAYHALTIRKTINFMKDFSDFADAFAGKIFNHLNDLRELPGGAPIVCFHNMDLEKLDVEYIFPVANPLSGKEDIKANLIPAQNVVTAIDMGTYENQDSTLEEILIWIEGNGFEMKGEIYYQYLNDPNETPEDELLTVMIVPIK